MRLVGAKIFLKTAKPGTLYRRYWLDSEAECLELINCYTAGQQPLPYYGSIEIFGDNSGSLAFIKDIDADAITIDGKTYDCLFYYDANVVGDASPGATLYLVYEDEQEWPTLVPIDGSDDEYLTTDELIKIKNWFVKNNHFKDESKGWAIKELECSEYYKNSYIVNYGEY